MNYHAILSTAGGVLAMVLFVPLLMRIAREGGTGQSFASWLLWGALDCVLTGSLIEQHGNFWVVAGFAIGDLAVAGLLAKQRRFGWGKFETMVLFLVVVCVIGWAISGPRAATIFSVTAVVIAGVPGFLSLKRNPDRTTAAIWFGYSVANLISFFGGTEMNLEQRFAPAVFTVASLLMAWAGWKKLK